MQGHFTNYLAKSIKKFNEESQDFSKNDFEFHFKQIEINPYAVRKILKTPLIVQNDIDIHQNIIMSNYNLGGRNHILERLSMRFPLIMVSLCSIMAVLILGYLIFLLPTCGTILPSKYCLF